MKIYDDTLDKDKIEAIKAQKIDYTDTPKIEGTESNPYRPAHQEILDKLPPDIVQELARRRLEELKTAGYKIKEYTSKVSRTSA
jgi:hypothetical protein